MGTEPLQWDTWIFASLDFLGGKNCLSKVWSVLRDEKLTGKVKRKNVSPSPVKTVKLARYDSSASKVLSLMAASNIKAAGSFDQLMPNVAPKSNKKCLSFPEVLPGCFEAGGGLQTKKDEKTTTTRARLLKQEREEESLRRDEANQKKITDWMKYSFQRMQDRKTELKQLEAMKKMKNDSMVKNPSLLSPVHGISFDPSPRAREILQLPGTKTSAPKPPVVPAGLPSSNESSLPFPTLSSALKEDVLKGVPARRKLFKTSKSTKSSSTKHCSPKPIPKKPVHDSKAPSLPKDVLSSSPQNVFSGKAKAETGSTAGGQSSDQEFEEKDASL